MASKKKVRKKSVRNPKIKLPKGYSILPNDFAKTWAPSKKGESVEGTIIDIKKKIKTKFGKQDMLTLKTKDGSYTVWSSASLKGLFKTAKLKQNIIIIYGGLGARKKGQSATKLFTVGIK